MRVRSPFFLAAAGLLAAACSGIVGETPVDTSRIDGQSPEPSAGTTQGENTGCVRFTGETASVDTGSVSGDALYLSGETFLCANDVVVVAEGNLDAVAAAAQLAAAVEGPLLFPDPRLAAELGRLKPLRVHTVGNPEVNTPNDSTLVVHDVAGAVQTTSERLATETTITSTGQEETIVESVLAIRDRDRVVEPLSTSATSTTTPTLDSQIVVDGLAQPSESETIWLVSGEDPTRVLLASAVGRTVGASVLAFDDADVLANTSLVEALAGRPADSIRFLGKVPEASEWEVNLLLNGDELPGGGFFILPADRQRRYVSFYGHPETTALGALGEQGPAATIERMSGFLSDYAADGAQVIPAFELIVSVAAAGATDDGDYSFEWPVDTFDAWIEYAAENDVYVILDLQPGRDDFLSQAVQYEELLLLPFVGLALDPEWRLTPNQFHLEQVGRVEAAEVNTVIDWLGDLVRENGLPQKMLIVHQFRTAMIQNRQDIKERPEIQVVIQMDGDGTEPQKDATWAALKEGADDAHWAWGWKNFFDEDEPGPPTPASTISKDPTPVYVSYQ